MAIIYNGNGAYTKSILNVDEDSLLDTSVLGKTYPVSVYYQNFLIKSFHGGIEQESYDSQKEVFAISVFEIGTTLDPIKVLGEKVRIIQIEIRSGVMYLFINDYVQEEDDEEVELKELEYFHFGANNISLSKEKSKHNACFISTPIEPKGTIASLDVKASIPAGTGIEFSLIANNNEYAIMPFGDNFIQNERVFYGLPTRFEVDASKDVSIYQNGEQVNVTLEAAINDSLNTYAVSYYPKDIQGAKEINVPEGSKIAIKYVFRSYGNVGDIASVKSATLMMKEGAV